MTNIYSAYEECCFSERDIFFDTNVWISIFGIGAPREQTVAYSDFYASALKRGNRIVVNEFVISEYFNRMLKIEYELTYEDRDFRRFKERRVTPEFVQRAESVRDDCLNILDDHEFVPRNLNRSVLDLHLTDAAKGVLDFTDCMILEQCKENDYIFVSHDKDFIACGLNFVTANHRVLQNSR